MKKLLSIFCFAIAIATFSSCKKEYITQNANQTILLNVPASAWTTADNGVTWSAPINTPEIDSYFNAHGGVLVYFSFTSAVYEQVPETYQGIAYSYTHNPGNITLYAQNGNGSSAIASPGAVTVKVVLVDSN
jgi:hypothetical protein